MRAPVAWVVSLLALAACGSSVGLTAEGDTSTTASENAFCTSAAALLNHSSFPSNGAGVVAELQTIDLAELSEADRQSFGAAIDQIEKAIYSFNNVDPFEGWSTKPVADVATRLCGTDMVSQFVMP